jgi:4'-phosphopantetheinyl transferase
LGNKIICQWISPPKSLSLEIDQVHVWRIGLDVEEQNPTKFSNILSEDEANRAEKFHFEVDRIRYAVMRATVRIILGNYLRVAPVNLEIAHSLYGKPYLTNTNIEKDLQFNISHAGNLGLIAVAIDRHIGVDLELVRDESSIESVAKRFFTPEEAEHLLSLPAPLQPEAFFTCWTRKEAFVKARGEGLSIPLDQFEVSFYPIDTPKLLNVKNDPGESGRWSMFHLDPGMGYVGALVVEGNDPDVMGWDWSNASNLVD